MLHVRICAGGAGRPASLPRKLKLGFGMESLPCGQFAANALFFRLGTLAYNLHKGFLACAFNAP